MPPRTDLAPSAGDLAPGTAGASSLSVELTRLSRVLHALKVSVTTGSGNEDRERAAHLLLLPLTRLGPLRQSALAELVHADPSTVSRHVTLLVERGLVRRVADELDGRASRLVVTPAGETVLTAMRQERDGLIYEVTADWTPEELSSFTGQLHRFVQDLTDHLPSLRSAATLPEKDR
ncbi:DNA-binding transcriptional regulator, MarR family [Modestobacter sp. DSM 44400]|uniref:MarR family winged helix-turn-helix transcriptional regulator n=1 Tax=Modestobacter sp. DSM 44400 TaxID=1550230 RepID=UPI0008988632|nr:MarR family transcriptional regulator [Modestobacter sp. DSM 44400]SDY54136.1 DNA-binding transcriptional regulator, MarR family [Modestobacter sp. DSM 44400]